MTMRTEDLIARAKAMVAHAEAEGIALRVAGGLGIAMRCASAAAPPLARNYSDIDLVGRGRERKQIVRLMRDLAYIPEDRFNAINGARRLLFFDSTHTFQIDVFLDRVEMCHEIDLRGRLVIDAHTLSLADLLLMKLQIVETNRKDLTDVTALLLNHPLAPDDSGINFTYLSSLAADDWGLWRTTTMVAANVAEFALSLEGFEHSDEVVNQARALITQFELANKSRSWKLRAKVGDRRRWYELPEEARG